jgi:hypothetical protein
LLKNFSGKYVKFSFTEEEIEDVIDVNWPHTRDFNRELGQIIVTYVKLLYS